jgi:hypothetical protein
MSNVRRVRGRVCIHRRRFSHHASGALEHASCADSEHAAAMLRLRVADWGVLRLTLCKERAGRAIGLYRSFRLPRLVAETNPRRDRRAPAGAVAAGRAGTICSWAGLIGLVLAGTVLAACACRSGVGLDNDSLVYLSAARHLSEGDGLVVSACISYEGGGPAALGRNPVALTHFPPLYPMLLGGMMRLGLSQRDVAGWLNVGLFSVNLAIIGLALRARCGSAVVALLATAWTFLSVDMIYLHAMALSEPLSLALGFGGLVVLGSWLERGGPQIAGLAIAGALGGLAALARYAGVAYIAAGLLALVAIPWAQRLKRFGAALIFGGIAAIPLGLLAVRNMTLSGGAANRRLELNVLEPGFFARGVETASSWVIPQNLPVAVKVGLLLGILFFLVRLYARLRGAGACGAARVASRVQPKRMLWIMACFVPCYVGMVIASKAVLDHGIALDSRVLAPVHVALIFLAALAGDRLAARYWLPVQFWIVLFGVLAALLAARCVVATTFAAEAGENGLALAHLEDQSELLATVRALPPGAEIYSNLSAMTAFFADRPVWPLAKEIDCDTAYLAVYSYQWAFAVEGRPPEDGPRSGLHPIRTVSDGRVYQITRR